MMLAAANDNLIEVPAGYGYYPEMGERPPASAIISADLSHYGRHYYLKFEPAHLETVLAAIKALKLRFSDLETYRTVNGGQKVRLTMTTKAYDKFRAAHREICTAAFLLD